MGLREELLALNPGLAPGGMSAPVTAQPSLQDDLLGRLDANPNGQIAPLTQAQALGLNRGSIAPPQPEAAPTGNMIPEYNSAGEQIGVKPEVTGPALFQNPFAKQATPPVPSGGKIGSENAKPVATPAANEGGAAITYKPRTEGAEGKGSAASNFYIPAGVGAGGGGKPSNPYANQLAALDKDKTQNMLLQGLRLDDARMQQEGAAADVNTIEAMQAEQQRQADEHAKKIDRAKETYQRVLEDAPHESIDADRWWGSRSAGQSIALILGAGLAGFAAGFNGRGGNEVIDQINREVDRDIMVQKENIANKKETHAEQVKGAETVYGMIRQGVQDDQAAAELTKAWTLDRMAAEAKQRAALSQNVAMQADAEAFRSAADMKIAELKDKAASAMAAKGAGFDRKLYMQTKQFYIDKGATNEQADAMALHDMGIVNAGNPNFVKEGKAGESAKTQAQSDEYNAQIGAAMKDPVLDKLGYGTAIGAKFGQRIAPESSLTEQELQGLNTRIMQGLLKTAKDAEGKPNVAMIERYEDRFSIKPTDTKEIALAKIRGIADTVNAIARQEGAAAPTPGTKPTSLLESVRGAKSAGQ